MQKALGGLHDKLSTTDGVAVEFAPEPLGGGPTRHMMCAIPGGIRIEFIATRRLKPGNISYKGGYNDHS